MWRPVSRKCTRAAALAGGLLALAAPRRHAAQVPGAVLAPIGGPDEERARVRQLLGDTTAAGFLIRTPATLGAARGDGAGPHAWLVAPEALFVSNSGRATVGNDGALWAGRGAHALVRAGAALRVGRVSVVLAPELTYSQNLGFQTIAAGLEGQTQPVGPFQARWFTGPYSVDLPLRFGDQPYTVVTLGQSAVTVDLGPVAAGVSSQDQWWGPGARNALLLSNAAEGVPHAFVRTARPLRTRLGDVEGRIILGTLTQSLYFTPPFANSDTGRALSGAVVTLQPAVARGLTVGAERLVLTPVRSAGAVLGHAADVFFRNSNLGTGDSLRTPNGSDQLTGLFARYVATSIGTEVYGEFTRSELPRTVRDALLVPLNTGAYTLGLAHAARSPLLDPNGRFAVRLEFTNLEQTRNFSDRPPPPDYYTGRAAPAGFTNRGQVLGAAIGPGSQSQYVAADYYAPRYQFGLFGERVRNQNDAFYRQILPNYVRHDVTIGGGVRAGARVRYLDARAELRADNRLNYLYQNGQGYLFGLGTVDVSNVGLTLSLTPRLPSAPR